MASLSLMPPRLPSLADQSQEPWWARFLLPLRIALPSVLLLAGLCGTGLLLVRELQVSDQKARETIAQEGRTQGHRTATLLAYLHRSSLLQRGPVEGIDLLVTGLATERDLSVALVLNQSNQVAYTNQYDLRGEFVEELLPPEVTAAIAASRKDQETKVIEERGSQYLTVVAPFLLQPQPGMLRSQDMGLLVLRYSLVRPMAQARSEVFQQVLLHSLPLAVTCLAAWLLLDLILAQRVQRLVEASRQLQRGDFSGRAALQGRDEIAHLSGAFDRMAATLQRDTESLRISESTLRQRTAQLEETLAELQRAQAQLVQTEKMSSLGQMVAGLAHELNNPVNFIYANSLHVQTYVHGLLRLVEAYRGCVSDRDGAIADLEEELDLEFLVEDFPQLLGSIQMGSTRIRDLVLSLRNFSRLDEADQKRVDLHEGIENTLTLLSGQLKGTPKQMAKGVVRQYGTLPPVECYPGLLNQVVMNLLNNALDALDVRAAACLADPTLDLPCITVRTAVVGDRAVIEVMDNGEGMTPEVRSRLFDPFFTTKPVGKGTGLGLAISYQIVVDRHGGELTCRSTPGVGSAFTVAIPVG
jgi:signal transduction histidine kinase